MEKRKSLYEAEKTAIEQFAADLLAREGKLRETDGEFKLGAKQLRALWTALCIHCDFEVDTLSYDSELAALWNLLVREGASACGTEFEDFSNFMAALMC